MLQMRTNGNNQIFMRALIFILTACTSGNNPFPGASGGGIKFTQAQISSLSRQEYGGGGAASNDDGNGSSGSGGGSSSSSSGGGGSSNGAGSAVASGVAAPGGGEVLVPKSFPLNGQEPTCEELRAMWIFSKRQSRAAEITNEIPTYRDPFAYNIWEPYYSTTRSMGGLRMVPRYGDRSRSPVFGRIVSREPLFAPRLPFRPRHMGELPSGGGGSRIYGAESKPSSIGALPRRQMQYRFGGSGGANAASGGGSNSGAVSGGAAANSIAVQGSFQKLKELIWTERAKELTQQRRAEELAARAAVLKEIANGQNVQLSYKNLLKSETPLMDENRNPDQDMYQHPADQQRLSIANGKASTNGRHRNVGGFSAGNRGGKVPKTAIFSGNPAANSGRAGRLLLPSMVTSSYGQPDELSHQRGGGGGGGGGSVGVAKAFPLRPSHFRERNRSLFKQPAIHPDHFRRNQRRFSDTQPRNVNSAIDVEAMSRLNVLRLLAMQEASAPSVLHNRKMVALRPIEFSHIDNQQEEDEGEELQLTEKQYNEEIFDQDQDGVHDQSEEQKDILNILSALPSYDAAATRLDYNNANQYFAGSEESVEN